MLNAKKTSVMLAGFLFLLLNASTSFGMKENTAKEKAKVAADALVENSFRNFTHLSKTTPEAFENLKKRNLRRTCPCYSISYFSQKKEALLIAGNIDLVRDRFLELQMPFLIELEENIQSDLTSGEKLTKLQQEIDKQRILTHQALNEDASKLNLSLSLDDADDVSGSILSVIQIHQSALSTYIRTLNMWNQQINEFKKSHPSL